MLLDPATAGNRVTRAVKSAASKGDGVEFQRDPDKERSNVKKHSVDCAEAMTVFSGPLELTVPDPKHSLGETRSLSVGESESGRLVIVSYTERTDHKIRLIGTRPTTARERRNYERRG